MDLFIKPGLIRCRFAPSPTGPFHIGSAHTTLFNYLFARKYGGSFILRIEDTDIERSDPKFETNILQSIRWLGLDYDEGPDIGGDFAPYRQSERTYKYSPYIAKLLENEKAYYCFHTEEELERERKNFFEAKSAPIHACEYRNLSFGEQDRVRGEKQSYIIRFKTPKKAIICFTDLIRGELKFNSDTVGDFSIAKSLAVPLYNLAVVVDDYEMKINYVIRGEEHIPNTPKQILIQEALEFLRPNYVHLPLILGEDKSKLSKRHGATSIEEYRNAGYLPETLFNFLALLGWNPGDNREFFSREELIKEFSIEKIQKSGAVFDIKKLDWMNGEYIRKKSSTKLFELCKPYLEDFLQYPISNIQFSNGYLIKIIELEQPRLKKLSEIGERTEYFFRQPECDIDLLRWKKMNDEEISASIDKSIELISNMKFEFSREKIEEIFLKEIGKGDKGKILWPLRVALTGKKASPGPFEIMGILGKGEVLKRLEVARNKFGK